MSTPGHPLAPSPSSSADPTEPILFASRAPEPSGRGRIVVAIIAFVLIALLAVMIFLHSRSASTFSTNTIAQADPYSKNLVFSELAMSQSTSLSGGTSTYIDGRVRNSGLNTLSGVTMQVFFRNDVALPPQIETLPLTLIRTHDPYVDIEPVSAAPLKPGDDAEFRLIIETVTGSWNQQMLELRVIHVTKR